MKTMVIQSLFILLVIGPRRRVGIHAWNSSRNSSRRRSTLLSGCPRRMYMCTCSSNRKHNRFLSYVPRMSRRTIRLGHVAPFRNATFQRTEGTHIVPYTSFFFPFVSTLAFRIVPPFSLLLLRPTIFFYLPRTHFHRSGGVPPRRCSQWEPNSTYFYFQGQALFLPSAPATPFVSHLVLSLSVCHSLFLPPSWSYPKTLAK